jgi:hypothetical protein
VEVLRAVEDLPGEDDLRFTDFVVADALDWVIFSLSCHEY